MFSVLKGWTCRFSFFAEIKHVTSPLSSGFLYSQISRVSFNIFRISISITSTVFPLHYHVSSPIRWTCSALIPAGTESYRQQGSQRGSCGGGEVFCFECHCDSFGLFLSPFLHVCVCVCVCITEPLSSGRLCDCPLPNPEMSFHLWTEDLDICELLWKLWGVQRKLLQPVSQTESG